MADITLNPLPPQEAIEFFRSKGLVESFDWRDVSAEEHAVAFTVGKAMRRDVLQDLREGVDKALAEGRSFEQFRGELEPLLRAKGWWGRKAMTDPLTGLEREVQLGSARRLRTIFDVNLRQAYAAGRWERAQASKKAFPFLRYVAVGGKAGDGRTRLQHREWHGTILLIDDPWWETHYGPCDYGCRCTAQQVNARMMARNGWGVTPEPVKFPPKEWINPRTGESSIVETGIGPTFNYNPGKARLDGVTPELSAVVARVGKVAEGGRPEITPRPIGRVDLRASWRPAKDDFYRQFDIEPGQRKAFTDLGGHPFPIGPRLFPTRRGPDSAVKPERAKGLGLAGVALRDPDEIRWVWGGVSRPALVRRYIRRAATDEGLVDVVVDTSVGGGSSSWSYRTSLDGALELNAARAGTLAWRRLPPDLTEAMAVYTNPGYEGINSWLRGGGGVAGQHRETISALDIILQGRRLTTDVELWRGASLAQVQSLAGQSIAPGDVILDPGFMSTSTSLAVARRFRDKHEDGIILRILARRGAPALDISRISAGGEYEQETLFARGARLKVLSFDEGTDILTLETVVDRAP